MAKMQAWKVWEVVRALGRVYVPGVVYVGAEWEGAAVAREAGSQGKMALVGDWEGPPLVSVGVDGEVRAGVLFADCSTVGQLYATGVAREWLRQNPGWRLRVCCPAGVARVWDGLGVDVVALPALRDFVEWHRRCVFLGGERPEGVRGEWWRLMGMAGLMERVGEEGARVAAWVSTNEEDREELEAAWNWARAEAVLGSGAPVLVVQLERSEVKCAQAVELLWLDAARAWMGEHGDWQVVLVGPGAPSEELWAAWEGVVGRERLVVLAGQKVEWRAYWALVDGARAVWGVSEAFELLAAGYGRVGVSAQVGQGRVGQVWGDVMDAGGVRQRSREVVWSGEMGDVRAAARAVVRESGAGLSL